MRDVLERVMELQPEWSSKKTPAMDERGQLVRHAGPDWLRGFAGELADAIGIPSDDLIIEGRDGTGPKTEVPWFRFGSESRSPSATMGWYCVYLFDTDGQTAYLSLGRGSTEWNGVEFKPRDHDELRSQADWARKVISNDAEGLSSAIDLKSRRSPLGPAYEAGTVVVVAYTTEQIPDVGQLKVDALRMARLLGRVYEAEAIDPSAPGVSPEVSQVVEASAVAAGKPVVRTTAGFRPNAQQRKAIEERGMLVAREALVDWGWNRVTDTSAKMPYDFHCQAGEHELYVEVKATSSDGAAVILTRNEVAHVRANFPDTALAVVSQVQPPTGDEDEATGGVLSFVHPWQVSDSDLSVISFVYTPPVKETEIWS